MTQPTTGWHVEDIKAAIRKRHGSARRLSIALGYGHRAVSCALTVRALLLRVGTPDCPRPWDEASNPLAGSLG
jgi:hypothetical protein